MPAQERVFALLKQHGWNATSFQVLHAQFQYFFDGQDACVAYVDTGGAWVAAGAPIAAEERLGTVAHNFVRAARERGRRASFFGTEQRFLDRAAFEAVRIGEQPVWNPSAWAETLRATRSLREQLRRARAAEASPAAILAAPAPGVHFAERFLCKLSSMGRLRAVYASYAPARPNRTAGICQFWKLIIRDPAWLAAWHSRCPRQLGGWGFAPV